MVLFQDFITSSLDYAKNVRKREVKERIWAHRIPKENETREYIAVLR